MDAETGKERRSMVDKWIDGTYSRLEAFAKTRYTNRRYIYLYITFSTSLLVLAVVVIVVVD